MNMKLFPAEPWIQRCKSPVGNPQLIQFSREIIDLLKSQPFCIMPMSKFIPSYHHHFAKQCRVSDYGYTKLLELLEAVPHVLQVLRIIMFTLSLLPSTYHVFVKFFCFVRTIDFSFPADFGPGFQAFTDTYPSCSSEALYSRPAEAAEISSQQTSCNQGLHAGVPLVSWYCLDLYIIFIHCIYLM